MSALPAWDVMIALQFENLVLNNRPFIWKMSGIRPEDTLSENPFFQHKTSKQSGCQIDYMVQTRFGCLYLYEIKFSRHPISYQIIEEVQKKIERLVRPKGLSCRPILIHVNGVHESVIESAYFSDILDFGKIFDDE